MFKGFLEDRDREPRTVRPNRTILLLVFGIVAVPLTALLIPRQKQPPRPAAIREFESEASWKRKERLMQVKKSGEHFTQAHTHLDNDDPMASFRSYEKAREAIQRHLTSNSRKLVRPGLTIEEWFDRENQRYLSAVETFFPKILSNLKQADFPVEDVRQLVKDYSAAGFVRPEILFGKAREAISIERARMAVNWARVTFSGNTDAYEPLIRKIIEEKWNSEYGYRLVYGAPLDDRERHATWKVFQFRVNLFHAEYTPETREQALGATLPQIPQAVEVSLNILGSSEIPTSWDNLGELRVTVPVPEAVLVDVIFRPEIRPADEVIASKRKELLAALIRRLEALPEFELFPDMNPGEVALLDGNRLNMPVARAIAYADREQLVRRIEAAAVGGSAALHEDICILAISMDIDELGSLVARILPALEVPKQRRVTFELRDRPYYAEYGPVLSMLENAPPGVVPDWALKALTGHMTEPRVKSALLRMINDPQQFKRQNHAASFLRECPMADLKHFAQIWMLDPHTPLAAQAFATAHTRNPEMAALLFERFFDRVAPEVQLQMLRTFRLDPRVHSDAILEHYREAALASPSQAVRNFAYGTIQTIADNPRGWTLLRIMDLEETAPKARELLRMSLLNHGEGNFPKLMPDLCLEFADSDLPRSRDLALQKLFQMDIDKTETFARIANLIRGGQDDPELLESVINVLHRHYSAARGWDFNASGDDLNTLLKPATGSDHPRVRQKAYDVLHALAINGNRTSRARLQTAYDTEKDEILVKRLRESLERLKAAGPAPASRTAERPAASPQ